MKKRILALILALVCAYSLVACGVDSSEKSSGSSAKKDEPASSAEPAEQEEEKEPEKKSSGKMVGSGDLGDYYVEIKDAFIAEDYEGNPAIIVTYAWTNNSEDTTSAMVAVHEKAFQDGVQLDTAIIMSVDGYESGTSMKDVRPGTTIDVQCAFTLTSETSTVELEISELISFSDDMVTMDYDPANL